MTNIAQRSFAGGEIAPSLYGRTDQSKYATAVRTMRNFIPQRHGGATNRPGTDFIRELKDSTKAGRAIPFIFDSSAGGNIYVLEFGDRTLRFAQDGGTVITTGVAAWTTATAYTQGDLVTSGGLTYYATSAHTSGATTLPGVGANWSTVWYVQAGAVYEIPTPYAAADLSLLQADQNADVMTLVHASYPPMELLRAGHTRWTLVPITVGPTIGQVANIASSGGSAGTVRYWAITAVDEATNEEGLPVLYSSIDRIASTGTPTLLTWNPVPGAIEYNVYFSVDGKTYGLKGRAGGIPLAKSDTSWTTTASSITTGTGGWVTAANQARNPVIAAVVDKAYDGNYAVKGTYTLTAVGATAQVTQGRVRVYYSRDGEARVDAGVLADTIAIYGEISSTRAFSGTVFVPDNGYATLTLDFVAEVQGYDPAGSAAFTCSIDTSVGPNNSVTWSASQTGFSDDGSAPSYQQAPPSQSGLFNATNQYPGVVGSYQQRRLLARTNAEPERAWASHPALRNNFATSTPLQDDDMVSWRLVGKRMNEIRHMLDLGQLIIFTSGSEQLVRGDTAGILRPGEINPQKISAHGADPRLAPLEVGDSAIYVQARGSQVRDLKPIVDGGTYQGTDLTVFAAHLFEGFTLADWAYAQTPNSVVWAVRSDGKLLSLTYLREHAVWGWSWHDTDGVVENVCVVPEGPEDRVYLIVRRTVNGTVKRYLERMARRYFADVDDAIFVDCGLSYDGWNTGATTMTLSGGATWAYGETLTLGASANAFGAGDVGNAIFLVLEDANGVETDRIRFTIVGYSSPTTVTGTPHKDVAAGFRGVALTSWAKAVAAFTGLSHLEGKSLAVLGDGFVVASPNNADYPAVTVAAGAIALGQPYAVVHAGLPFISDLETLDIDTASGPSIKTRKRVVKQVAVVFEKTRGGFVGRESPTGADPLDGLEEFKPRTTEALDAPPDLLTGDDDVRVASAYDNHGRIFLRQVDPLPMTVLAVIPRGDG